MTDNARTVSRLLDDAPSISLAGVGALVAPQLAPVESGRIVEVTGSIMRATGVNARLGELCELCDPLAGLAGLAEVTALSGEQVVLSAFGDVAGIGLDTRVRPLGRPHEVAVGDFLLGRVLNGLGNQYIDTAGDVQEAARTCAVWQGPPSPLSRPRIATPLALGVKALDGLLTVGVGQRVGIFAPAGCGKSTLLSMISRHAAADVVIVAMVGERGREVAEFIEDGLDEQSRRKSILVVSTSDRPATERLKAAFVATTYAEYFSEQGKSVLLLVDSVTRLARAAREIGLAAGEPVTRRGFPASVFSLLPQLFERAGMRETGSVTAMYTVLEESDDHTDPVAEEVRSLLDGTVSLSRELAGRGHFPAIDIHASVSRLMPRLVTEQHYEAARRARELLAKYNDVELLLRIGEYERGVDTDADAAIDCNKSLRAFLTQAANESSAPDQTVQSLLGAIQ